MSRHEGVSCDSCMKGNFRGKRYKCLICYDYDLCATCYEAGATTSRHTTDHPMQCILTRADFDIFYGGEALTAGTPQSYTCPLCGRMGFSEATLQEHVAAEHADNTTEVICPICASLPGGDPNHVTDDFMSHLSVEHHSPREFDEPPGLRHVRRIPHPSRGVGGPRARRANMQHFGSGASTLTGLSPSQRENMDPIAELLSQLSSVRNRNAQAQSVSSQLHQLEMQLQSTRQQLERLPRRTAEPSKPSAAASAGPPVGPPQPTALPAPANPKTDSQFLLAKLCAEEALSSNVGEANSEVSGRNAFVQELLLATLTEQLHLSLQEDLTTTLEAPPPVESTAKPSQPPTPPTPSDSKPSRGSPRDPEPVEEPPRSPPTPCDAAPYSLGASALAHRPPVCGPITVSNSQAIYPGAAMLPSGRAGNGRDTRGLNPAQAKRSHMLKNNLPSQRGASDTEPPPH